jgi:hypothetical protein
MSRCPFLCLALLCLLGAALAAEAPPNAIMNGGLETGMTGWQSGVNDPNKAGAAVTVDLAVRYKGAASLCLAFPTGSGTNVTTQYNPVQGGHDYLFTFWFRSEGFSRNGPLYDGANASYNLYCYDANNKQVANIGGGLPYGAQATWTRWMRMVTIPAAATKVVFTLGAYGNATAPPSKLWLDEIALRPWDGQTKPGGRTWVFNAGDGYYDRGTYRRAADDDAASGFSVIANTRFVTKAGILAGSIYTKLLPPGTYRALYRLRVGTLPDAPDAVASLDVNPQNGGCANACGLTTADFKKAGVYQEIPLRFVVSPETGYVDFRVNWAGKVTTWADTITIVEEESYNDDQCKALLY